jgi:hypothetical protein
MYVKKEEEVDSEELSKTDNTVVFEDEENVPNTGRFNEGVIKHMLTNYSNNE